MNNQIQKPQSFGNVQETYRYRLDSFNSGDQFSIVEDMPRNKPIRFETKRMEGQSKTTGKRYDFEAKTYLIRVVSRGYEADVEIKPKDLNMIAVLCPKGLENFKGATFVFDGHNWSYMGIDTNPTTQTPISSISQAMSAKIPEPPEQIISTNDQINTFAAQLADKVKFAQEFKKIYGSDIQTWADKITPNNGKALVEYAKRQGLITEDHEGVFKVV